MRNKVILIIILVAIIILLYSTLHGINIGNISVPSISQIREKNNNLEEKITEASNLSTISYPNKIDELEDTFEKYLIQKQKYEELSGLASNKKSDTYETKQYDISYLWRVLGKYATSRNLTLNIDVEKASKTESLYNFNFTVSGEYVNISQFITDLENDSELYFRIYNFSMTGSGTKITSSFTVKNVAIDSATITTTSKENAQ